MDLHLLVDILLNYKYSMAVYPELTMNLQRFKTDLSNDKIHIIFLKIGWYLQYYGNAPHSATLR